MKGTYQAYNYKKNSKAVSNSKFNSNYNYVNLFYNDFKEWTFDEIKAIELKGQWRKKAFKINNKNIPLDLEIGTGNGLHFAYYAQKNPQRLLLGLELKFKPLIQSIRKVIKNNSSDNFYNAKIIRYNAQQINDIFAKKELNNVFIFFPDPWPKKKKQKNRLLNSNFLNLLYELQQSNSSLEIKTDSFQYFQSMLEEIKKTKYKIEAYTNDLHNSIYQKENFVTQFENIFIKKNIHINWIKLIV